LIARQTVGTRPAQNPYSAMRPMILALLRKGDHKRAITHLQGAFSAYGYQAELIADMATCYWHLGEEAAAIKLMEAVTEDSSVTADALAKIGSMHLSVGDVEKAQAALARAISLRPGFVGAIVALNQIQPYPKDGHGVRTVRKLLRSGKVTRQEKSSLHAVLGRVEETSGGYALSLAHYARSRALIPGTYDPARFEMQVEEQIAGYDPGNCPVEGKVTAGPRVVFIVGMPRSGTTLVESILLRHPDVTSIGESNALEECLAQWRLMLEGHDEWHGLTTMTEPIAAKLRSVYFTVAARGRGLGQSSVIVDKTPLNMLHLGFARALFPDCRFVCMSRHPLDVGLSNFGAAFGEPFVSANPFLKDLEHIGHYSRWAWAGILDYQKKLGTDFRLQSYRRLVENGESEIRELVAHVGLNWNPDCLQPERRAGSIATASVLQVRSPIHGRRLDRWRAYGDSVQPLVDGFGGWTKISEWENRDEIACSAIDAHQPEINVPQSLCETRR